MMKIKTLVILMTLSSSLQVAASECRDYKGQKFPGSDSLNECEILSLGGIRSLYKPNGQRKDFTWNLSCDRNDEKLDITSGTPEEKRGKREEIAKKCEAMAWLLSQYERDWELEKHAKEVKASSNGNNQNIQIQNGQVISETPIQCRSEGIETIDYLPCEKFKNTLMVYAVAETITHTAQEVDYQGKTMSAQAKYAAEQNSATGALKAQGKSFEAQEDIYTQRMGIDSVKLAHLIKIYKEIPDEEELIKKCDHFRANPAGASKKDCEDAAKTRTGQFAFFKNSQQLDAMKSQLVKIGTSLGENTMLAALSGKRAKQINNAIADIDEFKPIDPVMISEEEANSTLCTLNPALPQCNEGGLVSDFDHINDNIIVFGTGATGTSYGSLNGNDNSYSNNELGSNVKTKDVGSVGSIIDAIAQDNSIEDSVGAKVTTKGTGEQGGGGGGGGGGASSTGAGTPPQTGEGAVAAVSGRAPSYAGGGGSLSVVGGMGINRRNGSEKDDNPFNKLFGKDQNKAGGVVNFREPAAKNVGAKEKNIFEMISGQYRNVTEKKMLIEYEYRPN